MAKLQILSCNVWGLERLSVSIWHILSIYLVYLMKGRHPQHPHSSHSNVFLDGKSKWLRPPFWASYAAPQLSLPLCSLNSMLLVAFVYWGTLQTFLRQCSGNNVLPDASRNHHNRGLGLALFLNASVCEREYVWIPRGCFIHHEDQEHHEHHPLYKSARQVDHCSEANLYKGTNCGFRRTVNLLNML